MGNFKIFNHITLPVFHSFKVSILSGKWGKDLKEEGK